MLAILVHSIAWTYVININDIILIGPLGENGPPREEISASGQKKLLRPSPTMKKLHIFLWRSWSIDVLNHLMNFYTRSPDQILVTPSVSDNLISLSYTMLVVSANLLGLFIIIYISQPTPLCSKIGKVSN